MLPNEVHCYSTTGLLPGGQGSTTINNGIVIPLRALFYTAMDDGRVPTNPATRHMRHFRATTEKEAQRVDFLMDAELSALLTTADKDYPQHADFFHVLAWTGLREGEACGLQWGDIDFRGRFLEVRRNVIYRANPDERRKGVKRSERTPLLHIGAPKSGEAGLVDMGPRLAARLQARRDMLAAEAAVSGRDLSLWVFPALAGCGKTRDSVAHALARSRILHLGMHAHAEAAGCAAAIPNRGTCGATSSRSSGSPRTIPSARSGRWWTGP